MDGVWHPQYFAAALRSSKASRWLMWRARWFGKRIVTEDDGHTVVAYSYRGKLYMWDFVPKATI